jgi:hypothetical protein
VYTGGSGYVNATNAVYKALIYDGQKPGFVSEDQAAGGGLNGYDVLVLPRTTNVGSATLTAIAQFEKRGGRVVTVGTDVLTADEHNRPLPAATRQAVIDGAAERFDASASFDTLRLTLLTDTERWGLQHVTLVDAATGAPVSGVEYETTRYRGKVLLDISSYVSSQSKSVFIEVHGKRLSGTLTDMISGHSLGAGPLLLQPITPVLLQLPGLGQGTG